MKTMMKKGQVWQHVETKEYVQVKEITYSGDDQIPYQVVTSNDCEFLTDSKTYIERKVIYACEFIKNYNFVEEKEEEKLKKELKKGFDDFLKDVLGVVKFSTESKPNEEGEVDDLFLLEKMTNNNMLIKLLAQAIVQQQSIGQIEPEIMARLGVLMK